MWKEFLYMTNREKYAFYTLIIIALILVIIIILIPQNDTYEISGNEAELFRRDIRKYEESILLKKPERDFSKPFNRAKENHSELFAFDPNSADSLSLQKLGFRPFHIRMILRYRQKGGKFRKPEDIARIPYLDKALANKLIPYAIINPAFASNKDTSQTRPKPLYAKQVKYSEGTWVDVATADTSELKKVPGIGSGMASAIVSYRSRLGGFYTIGQLREIRSITEENYGALCKFLTVSKPVINRIPVNKTGIEKLNNHPYLNFYQARAIIELRKKRGSIKNIKELSLFEEFSDKDFERLSYYLDFAL